MSGWHKRQWSAAAGPVGESLRFGILLLDCSLRRPLQ